MLLREQSLAGTPGTHGPRAHWAGRCSRQGQRLERLEKASLMPQASPSAAERPGSGIQVAFPRGGKGWRSELRTSRKGLWGAP